MSSSDINIPIFDLAKVIHIIHFVSHSMYTHDCNDTECNFCIQLIKIKTNYIKELFKLSDDQFEKIMIFLGENNAILNKQIQDKFDRFFNEDSEEISEKEESEIELLN